MDGKPGRPWYGEPASVPYCLHSGTKPMLTVQRLTDSMLVRRWSGCLLAVQLPSACQAGCGVVSFSSQQACWYPEFPVLTLGGACPFGKAGLSLSLLGSCNHSGSGIVHDEVLAPCS